MQMKLSRSIKIRSLIFLREVLDISRKRLDLFMGFFLTFLVIHIYGGWIAKPETYRPAGALYSKWIVRFYRHCGPMGRNIYAK